VCESERESGRWSEQKALLDSRDSLQHATTRRNALQHAITHCNSPQCTATRRNALQHAATHCNTPQRTEVHMHCNTPQHTAALSHLVTVFSAAYEPAFLLISAALSASFASRTDYL